MVGNDKFGEVVCTTMNGKATTKVVGRLKPEELVTWQLGGEKPPDGEDAPS